MKITKENLISEGFKKYGHHPLFEYKELYQKAIYHESVYSDDCGKCKVYYLNIKWYDFSDIDNHPTGEGWGTDVQFNLKEDETVNVEFCVNANTELKRVQEFYDTFFDSFDCIPCD